MTSLPTSNADVIVIGAGVLGVSIAYHLAQRGQRVLVLERERTLAQHASSKNAGMFRHLYRHPQLTEWALRSRQLWPSEIRGVAFRETGSLIVDRELPDHHPALFEQREATEAGQRYAAVLTPRDGLLSPYDYVYAIYQHTDKTKAQYKFGQTVVGLQRVGKEWQVETESGQGYRAPWVVNAAGAWLKRFLTPEQAAYSVDAIPFARHLFVVNGWEEGFMPAPHVGFYWNEAHGWYLRLWEKGSRLVSICDQTPANPEQFIPTSDLSERVAQRLLASVPTQAPALSLGPAWFCFRTYTEDQRPMWGEDAKMPGFFWLGAFGGFGMSTAFGATADAADALCGKQVHVSPDFLPSRPPTSPAASSAIHPSHSSH